MSEHRPVYAAPRRAFFLLVLSALMADAAGAQTPVDAPALSVTLRPIDGGMEVMVEGKLFTRYLEKSGNRPILWPLLGPGGQEMTRGYPMREATPTENNDHVHHRSFWFTHGDVNGVSFWHEDGKHGEIIHRGFVAPESGSPAVLITRNDWVGRDGQVLCKDQRTFRFFATSQARWLDCELVVSADQNPARFGDTKEGSFGVRVAGTMKVEAKLGGRIVTSEGLVNEQAWGKPAAWVDYSGPVEETTVGLAIMNHPSSFRFPTHWHVRTYGLFTANPFGLGDFISKDHDGSLTLQPGESFTLRYRVYLHMGDVEQGQVAAVYRLYSELELDQTAGGSK